ncbi:MAG: pilus assembly protein [Oligoflexia bacterium]|nr:pilus assembly protein [Oligoflexia bacterium]
MRTLRRSRRGIAAIEFAFTLPFMLTILMGIVELSLLQTRMYLISRAARDACRIGSGVIEGADADGTEIKAVAVAQAREVLNNADVDCNSGCDISATWFPQGDWMVLRVDVGVPYQPFTGLLPMIPDMTRGNFVMLTQQQLY